LSQKEIGARLGENTLFFAAFFTPLLFFTPTHDQFELPKLILTTLLLAGALILLGLQFRVSFPKDGLSLSLLFFFLTQLFASLPFTSLSWTTSFLGDYENFAGWATLGIALVWYWFLTQFLTRERIEKTFLFALLAGFLSSLYALAQHFGFDFIQWNSDTVIVSREFAALGNPNFLAAYLAMVLPAAFWFLTGYSKPAKAPHLGLSIFFAVLGLILLFLAGTGGQALFQINSTNHLLFLFMLPGLFLTSLAFSRLLWARTAWSGLFVLVVLILGLLSTQSRGGFLAALAALGFFLIISFKDLGGLAFLSAPFQKISRPWLFLGGAAALTALAIFGSTFFSRLFDSIIHMGDSLATSRLHIWRPALKMIAANPLHGVGLDTFKIAFPFYSGIEFNQIDGMFMSSRTAHNELIQITAATGFLGLAAYLSALFFFVRSWRRAYSQASNQSRGLLLVIFGCALAYQVQNLFSFGVAAINFLWFFCLAAVQKLSSQAPEASGETAALSGAPGIWRRAICLLLALLLTAYGLTRLAADTAFAGGNAINDLLKHHNPNLDPDRLIDYSNYGISETQKAIELCPWEVKYSLYRGLAYEERARLDSAHEEDWLLKAQNDYWKAISMSPANAYYYNDLGRVEDELALSDPKALDLAVQSYERAVYFAPASPYFRMSFSQALEAAGQKGKAKDQLNQAFALDPAFTGKLLTQTALQKYQNGQPEVALAELTEAIRRDGSNGAAYYYRGLIELDKKNKKLALADLAKAKELNPGNAQIDKFLSEAEGKK
jgi:Tfp pilus assembly protein PilF